jgi:hypothetical protein
MAQTGQIQWKYSDPIRRLRNNVVSATRHSVGYVTWLSLRLTLVREGCRRVKFGADGWVDPLDSDGIHVCGFALRQLTRNFFDLAVEEMEGQQTYCSNSARYLSRPLISPRVH